MPSGRLCTLASFLSCALTAACAPATATAPHDVVRIATGSAGGVYHRLGIDLAQAYASRLDGVAAVATASGASPDNVYAVETDAAELAFALGDVAYIAYTRGGAALQRPYRGLRAIAVLYPNVIHVMVRRGSPIAALEHLRGKRVGVGRSTRANLRGRSLTLDVLLEAHGVPPAEVAAEWMTLPDLLAALHDGTIDAAFFSSGYPQATITEAARSFGLRFLPVDAATAASVRPAYPFLKLTAIPAGTYPGQASEVLAVGVDNLLVCRDDLSDDLVYRLTRTFFESLPELGQRTLAARLVDVERAPATPIPLHPGAARYYRERELLRW